MCWSENGDRKVLKKFKMRLPEQDVGGLILGSVVSCFIEDFLQS